jgi:hypothetical protein
MLKKFPESEGYKVRITRWETPTGTGIDNIQKNGQTLAATAKRIVLQLENESD